MSHKELLITNARIVTERAEQTQNWLFASDGRIARLGAGDAPDYDYAHTIDARGAYVLPGFIDIHVHGGADADTMDANPASLTTMARFYAQHGVTAFLATTWTATPAHTLAALQRIAAQTGPIAGGATLLGAHLEGPFLNEAYCGAQDTQLIRRAMPDEALSYLELGVIRLLALAPEFAENGWLLDACVARGITLSAAHTGATYAQMREAIARGLRGTTHTFNAMRGLHHREPGTVGAALSSPELYCEVIADGIHVHPAALNVLARAKGPDGIVLITDAMRAAGMPDGVYPIDAQRSATVDGAAARLADGTLAGSVLTFERGFATMLNATGWTIERAWPISSLNAARAIGVAERKGSIALGKDADLVILNDDLSVRHTVMAGEVVGGA